MLSGISVLPLGQSGRNLIGLTILLGAIVLCCLPEIPISFDVSVCDAQQFLGRFFVTDKIIVDDKRPKET